MSGKTSTHYRTCNLCEAMCGVEVEIDGDEVVSIRGDERDVFSRGHVCPKATALKDLYEDPDRLKQPVRRVGDRWEPISWDEAFDEVVDRIHQIQQEHGRDAVGVYQIVHGFQLFAQLHLFNQESAVHGLCGNLLLAHPRQLQ